MCNKKDGKRLVVATESLVENPTLSATFHAQSLFHFGEKVLYAYCGCHDLMNRQKLMDGAGPAFFDERLNFSLENTAIRRYGIVTVLQQYIRVIGILRYDANDKRWL